MLVAVLLLLASPAAERPRLAPIDQCASAGGFKTFRNELFGVIERKDVNGLLALTDDKVMVNFGGAAGHAAMRREWALDNPQQSKLWAELNEVLSLGCALSDGVAVAPSMMETLPDDADAFETVVVIKPSTLRAAPDAKARPIELLNWDLVTAEQGVDELGGWTKVKMKDGRSGFVRSEAVRSPIDYRALFRKVDGQWRMTAFVAGD